MDPETTGFVTIHQHGKTVGAGAAVHRVAVKAGEEVQIHIGADGSVDVVRSPENEAILSPAQRRMHEAEREAGWPISLQRHYGADKP